MDVSSLATPAAARDAVQERLVVQTLGLGAQPLADAPLHAAKGRILDTIGALYAGFDGPPCRIARAAAKTLYQADGATIAGTADRSTIDFAAFVNGTTARFAELNDTHHVAGKPGLHASDTILPLLAVAEYRHSSGSEYATAVAVAYQISIELLHGTDAGLLDTTNYVAFGTAAGAAVLLDLSAEQLRHCFSLAAVSSNAPARVRLGDASMWKAAASGEAGRRGVQAALLAAHGMEGPSEPFSGTAGWLALTGSSEDAWRDRIDTASGIETTIIKPRGACGKTIPAILAAEKVHPQLAGRGAVERVLVETYRDAKLRNGTGAHHWQPTSRETADHSIPYVVAAALVDGTVGPPQFDPRHLADPELAALVQTVQVAEEPEFTKLYEGTPCVHRTRVTVSTADGAELVGESGGDYGEISDPMSEAELETKFHGLVEGRLGAERSRRLAATLWQLEQMGDVADLLPLLSLEAQAASAS